MAVGSAFQLADIPVEGNEVVGEERFEPSDSGFNAAGPRFNFAVQLPPYGDQDAQDRNEGG